MFEFFQNIFYLLLVGLILILSYITMRNAWSKEIISKQPSALIWNNSLIILEFILIIAVFFIFSWTAGITTIILALIISIFVGKKITNKIESNIINSAKKDK